MQGVHFSIIVIAASAFAFGACTAGGILSASRAAPVLQGRGANGGGGY